jgi:hypothetical protein
MTPDFTCTLWIDGWPWATNLWRHCCIAHDLGGSDWQLFQCVAETGGAKEFAMGLIMGVGVFLWRYPYRLARWVVWLAGRALKPSN